MEAKQNIIFPLANHLRCSLNPVTTLHNPISGMSRAKVEQWTDEQRALAYDACSLKTLKELQAHVCAQII